MHIGSQYSDTEDGKSENESDDIQELYRFNPSWPSNPSEFGGSYHERHGEPQRTENRKNGTGARQARTPVCETRIQSEKTEECESESSTGENAPWKGHIHKPDCGHARCKGDQYYSGYQKQRRTPPFEQTQYAITIRHR